MSDRPYQDYSELELFDLLRIYEKGVQETERERNEFLNRGFDLDFPDVRELKSRLDSQSETLALIDQEFAARREERAARRLAEPRNSAEVAAAIRELANQVDALGNALASTAEMISKATGIDRIGQHPDAS